MTLYHPFKIFLKFLYSKLRRISHYKEVNHFKSLLKDIVELQFHLEISWEKKVIFGIILMENARQSIFFVIR